MLQFTRHRNLEQFKEITKTIWNFAGNKRGNWVYPLLANKDRGTTERPYIWIMGKR